LIVVYFAPAIAVAIGVFLATTAAAAVASKERMWYPRNTD
jgi:hypothetical protein